ncbi:MAG: pyridoxal phosphate-dependent aminotransferase [Chthoniobacterales bacterium]
MTFSRRHFAHLLGAGAAAAVLKPVFSFTAEGVPSPATNGVVRLSSNENPYGPSAQALEAMRSSFDLACRYPDEHNDHLIESLAQVHGVEAEQILLGDGSGEILKLCAAAFTGSKDRPLVAGDPTFEAILKHATVAGANVVKVPLTSTFAHDLPRMAAMAKGGLVYVCNPNNPTASITPKKELRDFIAKAPRETMILVDEAYFHFADAADYESVIPLIKDHPSLLVARTFSKIYGMAGLRCGYCLAQKATIDRLRPHQPWDSVNILALAAAITSLSDADQVAKGQRLIGEAKTFVLRELDSLGYKSIPSQANFIMVDLKKPVVPLIAAMKQRNVQVGRLFPALPNHMRVTIGKQTEMETFVSVFREVIV